MKAIILLLVLVSAVQGYSASKRSRSREQDVEYTREKREAPAPDGFEMFLPDEVRDTHKRKSHRLRREHAPEEPYRLRREHAPEEPHRVVQVRDVLEPEVFKMNLPGNKLVKAPENDASEFLFEENEDRAEREIRRAPQSEGFKMFLPHDKVRESHGNDASDLLSEENEDRAERAIQNVPQSEGFKLFLPHNKVRESHGNDASDLLSEENEDLSKRTIRKAPPAGGFRMFLPGNRIVDSPEKEEEQNAPDSSAFDMFPLAEEVESGGRVKRDIDPMGMDIARPNDVPYLARRRGPRRIRTRRRRRDVSQPEEEPQSNLDSMAGLNLTVYQEVNEPPCGCGCGNQTCDCPAD